MTFALLSDDMYMHPKIITAGNEAIGVWSRGLSYCAKYLTDGYVPETVFRSFCDNWDDIKQRLVNAKLLEHDTESGALRYVNYLQLNRSSDEEKTRKSLIAEKRSAAGRRGAEVTNRQTSGKHTGKRAANGSANTPANGSAKSRPYTSSSEENTPLPPKGGGTASERTLPLFSDADVVDNDPNAGTEPPLEATIEPVGTPSGTPVIKGAVKANQTQLVNHVLDMWSVAYEAAVGLKPTINKHARSAAKQLVSCYYGGDGPDLDVIGQMIDNALAEPWFRKNGHLGMIANTPDRYRPKLVNHVPVQQPVSPAHLPFEPQW